MEDPRENPRLQGTSELRVRNVQLILGPKGIEIDEAGRIKISEPEILQALVMALPSDLDVADDTNYVNCGANNYQCGK